MVFTHLLTKIVIDITNNSANTIQEVTLKGIRCTATVDLSTKSVRSMLLRRKRISIPFQQ